MKNTLLIVLMLHVFYFSKAQDWTQLADIPGSGRFWSSGFTIDNKIYAGTGRTGFSGSPTQDMWEYDIASDTWSQVADYPAGIREGADGFGDGTRGFLAFGTSFIQFTNLVYEYLPTSNTWEQKATAPASFAYSHGFTLNGKYYIGPENGTNKMFAYTLETDSWEEVAPFPGQDRRAQVAFTAGGKGYIGMGMFVFGGVLGSFYAYDPALDEWEEIAAINPVSDQSCATSINDVGYVFNVGGNAKNVYRYNEASDEWQLLSGHPGDRIANSTFIGAGNAAYLVFGERTVSGGNTPSQQTWRYIPSTVNVNSIESNFDVSFKGAHNGHLLFSSELSFLGQLSVWSLNGKQLLEQHLEFNQATQSSYLSYRGIALYQISDKKGKTISGKCYIP